MKEYRTALFVTIATCMVASATASAQVNSASYVCNDGSGFSAAFNLSEDNLTLSFPGGFSLVLSPAATGSGMRYTGGGFEFRGKGPDAELDRPGQPPLNCRQQSDTQLAQQQAAAPQATGPSFDCSGRLNPTEQRICANPELADLDRKMANTYSWLQTQLSPAKRTALAADQRQWLSRRNACGTNDDCIHGEVLERTGYLNEYLEPNTPPAPQGQSGFPFEAKSWGGIVRSGPGQHFARAASLAEGERITVLQRTPETFQDRPWFLIRYRGTTGYHWGGIICPIGQAVDGTFEVCN
ncbi:MAG: MliC family protein [Pseudomonadota bacterium]|nr:MliC family protein [Pseudomonadota bacterium]